MLNPAAVIAIGMIDGAITTITQSWYLTAIAVAIILSIGLSVLSGLIDIAAYLTMLAVVVLVFLGILNQFAPGLMPLAVTPSVLGDFLNPASFQQVAQTAASPLIPSF